MRFDSYVDFENEFRGDTESILSQFSKYDALINLIIKDIDNPILVDIGSGRGEWLQKWSNKIDDCSGIENDPDMIAICREKDLNIIDGDALTILQTLPSNSVSSFFTRPSLNPGSSYLEREIKFIVTSLAFIISSTSFLLFALFMKSSKVPTLESSFFALAYS